MTISMVTTETIAGVADLKAGYTLGHADVAILKALAAELLAVREAQPVWVDTEIHDVIQDILQGGMSRAGRYVSFHKNQYPKGFKQLMPIYTTPPAPAVPDFGALTKLIVGRLIDCGTANDDSIADAEVFVYNACRAAMLQLSGNSEHVSQGYTFDGLNIRAVAALRAACSDQWLKSEEFADKVYWQNMHSIANEIIEAMAAAPTPTKAGE